MSSPQKHKIGVLGMGYVGLPLAVEFSNVFEVIGYDINEDRIGELKRGSDSTNEVPNARLKSARGLTLTASAKDLLSCNVFILTVPTPLDKYSRPDLTPLLCATATVGGVLKKGDIVIYESTVYPGATEDDCAPILEEVSGLKLNIDFFLGYSPERINPGDRARGLTDIVKVVSGSTDDACNAIDSLYKKIIKAGTYKTLSIREAEAAKVIENTQRDVNIALINELSILFDKLDIDTERVLAAAETKWNFLPFKPGLVGGHCIGVDPYYLTHKAAEIGYTPEIILSGRRLNDAMSVHVVNKLIREMSNKRIPIGGAKVLVMGITFKENCPDIRNSKVIDVVNELKGFGCEVSIFDPLVSDSQLKIEYNMTLVDELLDAHFDSIIIAVGHDYFKNLGLKNIRKLAKETNVIFDMKYLFGNSENVLKL